MSINKSQVGKDKFFLSFGDLFVIMCMFPNKLTLQVSTCCIVVLAALASGSPMAPVSASAEGRRQRKPCLAGLLRTRFCNASNLI